MEGTGEGRVEADDAVLVEAPDEVGAEGEPFAGLLPERLLVHLTQKRRSGKIMATMQRVTGQGKLKLAFPPGYYSYG